MMITENNNFRVMHEKLAEYIAKDNIPLIITEGKTDILHIKKAKHILNISQDIEFYLPSDEWCDNKLLSLLENIALITNKRKVIGIFDRDSKKIIQRIEENNNYFHYFGNNVFAFCLPIPEFRNNYTNLPIELYYKDEDLKRQKDGCCIYFDNEIELVMDGDKTGGFRPRIMATKNSAKEYVKKVYATDIGELSGVLSKTHFASLVHDDLEFSNDIDFSAFNLIFDRINSIIDFSEEAN